MEILKEILELKKQEKDLATKRKILEKEAIEKFEDFDGLSKTFEVENLKVTIKKTETYKFIASWKEARENIPPIYRPERIKFEVDKKAYDSIKEKAPDAYLEISKYVDYKQGSTSIDIKE